MPTQRILSVYGPSLGDCGTNAMSLGTGAPDVITALHLLELMWKCDGKHHGLLLHCLPRTWLRSNAVTGMQQGACSRADNGAGRRGGSVRKTLKWDVHHAGLARYRQGVGG
jgi:hypothetical protein